MMRKELIGAVSALALLTAGAALAQTTPSAPGTPPPTATQSAPGATAQSGASGQATQTMASVEEMIGKDVVGADGEDLGEVDDVILDPSTRQARQVVISSGGFLGIGDKKIAVDASQLQLQSGGDNLQVSGLTKEQIRDMPEFEYNESMVSWNRSRQGTTGAAPGATGAGGATGTTPAAPSQ